MSRKIKINTVNTTDLENTLNKNLCKKHVTISGPEKTIVVSDDTTPCSVEEFKAQLEREREEKKEIRKTIDDSKNAVKRYQEKTSNENMGDAIASTNNTSEAICQSLLKKYPDIKEKTSSILANINNDPLEENKENRLSVLNDNNVCQNTKNYINSIFLYEKLSKQYINTVVKPIFDNFCDNEVLINTYTNVGLFKPLFDLFKNNNIKSIDDILLNDGLNLKIGQMLLDFNKEYKLVKQNKLEDYLNLFNLKNKDIEPEESKVTEETIKDSYAVALKGSYAVDADKVGEFFLSIPKENIDIYEEVNHPNHYNNYDVEVIDMMERIFGIKETMNWCKLNAFKYRRRAGHKPTSTVEKDLKKEKWCLDKYNQLLIKYNKQNNI